MRKEGERGKEHTFIIENSKISVLLKMVCSQEAEVTVKLGGHNPLVRCIIKLCHELMDTRTTCQSQSGTDSQKNTLLAHDKLPRQTKIHHLQCSHMRYGGDFLSCPFLKQTRSSFGNLTLTGGMSIPLANTRNTYIV